MRRKILKSNKLKVVLATAFAGAALLGLSACSSGSIKNSDIITMKGDTVSISDFYKEAKEFPGLTSNAVLQNLTFEKMFEKVPEVKKAASEKKIDKQYNTYKKQYGSSFESVLSQSGLNTNNIKDYLKVTMMEQAAITKDIKDTQYTKKNLETAFASYQPAVKAYVVSETSKDAADKALAAAKKDTAAFKKTNASKETTFDSNSTTVPAEVQTAAYKLKDGQFSSVISAANAQTGATSYYIVLMDKAADKGKDMNKYKSELEKTIKTQKMSDSTYTSSVFAKYLKKNNVTVKDSAFSSIFSQFTANSSSSSK